MKLDDIELNTEIGKKFFHPNSSTDTVLNFEYNINQGSHHIQHSNSKLAIKTYLLEIEKIHVNKIVKQMADIKVGFLNQHKFRYQTVFSAILDKRNEDYQVLYEVEA